MKFTQSIEINLPREKVIELFDIPDNMKHWQPRLIIFENISGSPGEVGIKSRLKYKMVKRDVEMIETIANRNLPDEFSGIYQAKGVWNEVKNYFTEISPDKTKWISISEFKFSSFTKIMGIIMPEVFRKESYKYLKLFKEFAEKSSSKE
jgi:hypothetical protein